MHTIAWSLSSLPYYYKFEHCNSNRPIHPPSCSYVEPLYICRSTSASWDTAEIFSKPLPFWNFLIMNRLYHKCHVRHSAWHCLQSLFILSYVIANWFEKKWLPRCLFNIFTFNLGSQTSKVDLLLGTSYFVYNLLPRIKLLIQIRNAKRVYEMGCCGIRDASVTTYAYSVTATFLMLYVVPYINPARIFVILEQSQWIFSGSFKRIVSSR